MIKLNAICILLAGLVVAGCSAPRDPIQIRPGIGAEVDLNAISPPSGMRYNFALVNEGVPVPVTMSLTSRKRSNSKYTYNGQMVMTLPEAENLEDIAQVLSEAMGKSSIRVRGNQLFIPVGLTADNRFRSTSSNITGDVTKYAPHDCFGVLGTCRYKAIARDGSAVSLITKTTEEGGVWRSTTVLDPKANNAGVPNETRRSVYSIDQNAVLIDMFILRSSGAERSDFAIKRK
ncbi:hypothetical protein [Litoreibacter albidus]|uniref:hypothetical protein n=1 Tax=Litoreibacter albidus TaxID=670155 RepID=UPI003735052F